MSSEPCPFCGCPGAAFDGHVCEDYMSLWGKFVMNYMPVWLCVVLCEIKLWPRRIVCMFKGHVRSGNDCYRCGRGYPW